MPELPEVEVSRQGIKPYLMDQRVKKLIVRQPKLRWMVPDALYKLTDQRILAVKRRAKYLILETEVGSALIHLGMSGSLSVLDENVPPTKHDHLDLVLQTGKMIRYNDPRRFGSWLWQEKHTEHALLQKLGPEPLTLSFDANWLALQAKNKRTVIKQLIMNNAVVVGVGNIYASESLFNARIHPLRPACTLSDEEHSRLVAEIKNVLETAIRQGGTTLKDFSQTDGKPGYFAQELKVYGRDAKPCLFCKTPIESCKIGQRNSYYCPHCQH